MDASLLRSHIGYYERFLHHQAKAERAIGRYIVERLEAGHRVDSLTNLDTGIVRGTDKTAKTLVSLSGVAHSRALVALKSLNKQK